MEVDIVKLITEDKEMVLYRPSLNKITGSVTATILLQQCLYWWKKNGNQPFYKFKEPCSHELYRKGDSWCEELGFSVREFEGAIRKIGFKRGAGVKNQTPKTEEEALIIYYTNRERTTTYLINESLLSKLLFVVYSVNDKSAFTKYTETTTETTVYDNNNNNIERPIIIKEDNEVESNDSNDSTLTFDPRCSPLTPEKAAKIIIGHYNLVYGKKLDKGPLSAITKRGKTTPSLIEYWMNIYSLDEIKQAITNSKYDNFWKDKLTPLILLRMKNPRNEPVDYIGNFLNMKIPKKIRPLTEIEFYQVAKKLGVDPRHTKKRYASLMDMVEKGTYENRDDSDTVEQSLIRWVESDLQKGYVDIASEIDLIEIENLHPKNILASQFYDKRKEYQDARNKLLSLKEEYSTADEGRKAEIKLTVKQSMPQLKELEDQYKKILDEMDKMSKLYDTKE